jgi:O-antigen biosynthesis alpha-1,3-rhamnosyltransferase
VPTPTFAARAMSGICASTPVIAVRNAAVEELAGEAALIVDDFALPEAMQRFDRDARLQKMMGQAGRIRAAQFSWAKSAEAHIEAYTLASSVD